MLAAGFVAALALSALGSRWAIVHAHRNDLLDQPGERRSHRQATPRGGGIAVVAVLLLALAVLAARDPGRAAAAAWAGLGLALVAGIGWIDDHRPLSPGLRLLVQCLAGVLLAWGLHAHDGRWGWALLACALVPVLVNVWNFMDGINGLAYGQALLAAFDRCRRELPIGYAAFHLPRVLEWLTAGRQYKQAYELLRDFPIKLPNLPIE